MENIKNKIINTIRETNGFPNRTRREYVEEIKNILKGKLSQKDLELIRTCHIDLDDMIIDITEQITRDLF